VTTPTTTTYDELKSLQNDLIRKALEGSVFLAPYAAAAPTALTSGANAALVQLPTDYEDVGWCDKGTGATWSRSVDTSDVTSWGSVEPTRRDITKETKGIKFIAQETKRKTIELYEGVDLSSVTPTATTGEITFDSPDRPQQRYFRVFGLFQDGVGVDTIYVAKLLPMAVVTDTGEQKWADGDDPVGYEVSLTAMKDPVLKTAVRHFFGGPGWRSRLADMGFPVVS
jgi:hypothetical protein